MRFQSFMAATALLLSSLAAHGEVISGTTSGTALLGSSAYLGQAFLVDGTGVFDDISFNFVAPTSLSPYALGTGYLFSTDYVGSPQDLSSATAAMGLIGTTEASGGLYTFDSSVLLAGGGEYYFYEDAAIPAGSLTGFAFLPGAIDYFATSPSDNFIRDDSGASSNYIVDGSAVTPEPSGIVLLSTGVLGFAATLRRRFA